jgi:hypothetical protein
MITTETSSGTPGYIYEKYAVTLTRISGATNQTWFKGSASCHYDPGHTMSSSVDPNLNFSNEQTGLPAFWYPYSSSATMKFDYFSTLTIEGTVYTNVQAFISTNGLQPSDANFLQTTYYWVKGIGIIKKETRTANSVKTYLLLRYGQ